MEKETHVWYVQGFLVAPNYRGQKVGSKLMEGIQMKANELKKIVTLQVEKHKPENIAFYKKNGFIELIPPPPSKEDDHMLVWFPNIGENSKQKTTKKKPTPSKKKKEIK